jgi:hypothetical protein
MFRTILPPGTNVKDVDVEVAVNEPSPCTAMVEIDGIPLKRPLTSTDKFSPTLTVPAVDVVAGLPFALK